MNTLLKYFIKYNSVSVVIFFLLLYFLQIDNLNAQRIVGPFSYSPIEPSVFLWNNNSLYNQRNVSFDMSQIPAQPTSDDGIMLKFTLNFSDDDYVNENAFIPIVSMSQNIDGKTKIILQIFYKNYSIVVRKWYWGATPGFDYHFDYYYDYYSYDRMFDEVSQIPIILFEFKLYFTENFLFMANKADLTNRNYITPILFGVNDSFLGFSTMSKFLNRDSGATITVGNTDANSYQNTFVNDVRVYSFKYSDLRTDIQNNFMPN